MKEMLSARRGPASGKLANLRIAMTEARSLDRLRHKLSPVVRVPLSHASVLASISSNRMSIQLSKNAFILDIRRASGRGAAV